MEGIPVHILKIVITFIQYINGIVVILNARLYGIGLNAILRYHKILSN